MSLGEQELIAMLPDLTAPLSTARGLPNAAYVDPELFELERHSLLGRTWTAIAYESELPGPGTAKPVDFMGAPLLLVCDRDGGLNVFHNVCSHRGMKLVEQTGRVRTAIRCPYHSWSYSLHGDLLSTPLVGGNRRNTCTGFDKAQHGLKPVDFAVWMGIVFVDLSGGASPFERCIGPLEERWEPYLGDDGYRQFRSGSTGSSFELELACNWKLAIENYCEAYHLPWVHRSLNEYSPLEAHFNITHGEGMAGQGSRQYDPATTAGMELPRISGWPDGKLKHAEYIALYPNTLLGLQADHFFSVIVFPQAADRSLEKVHVAYVGDAATEERYAACRQAVLDGWELVFREDIAAVEGMQAGRRSPGFTGGVLTPVQDVPTHHFHRWVSRAYANAIGSMASASSTGAAR